jgi:hypothetical protein
MKMKKRWIIILALIFGLAVQSFVFAATEKNELPQWFKEMVEWRQEQIQQSLEEGAITEEQAAYWKQHLEDMEEFHEENGFGTGICGGNRYMGGRSGRGRGFGPGMMQGGYNWRYKVQ